MTAPALRDYQSAARDAVLSALRRGNRRPLVVLPTGSGKSVILGAVTGDFAARGDRVLMVAHREELIGQLTAHAAAWCGADAVGVVMAKRDEAAAQIVIGSLMTLRSPDRLARILAGGPVSLVVIDEAHHATKGSVYERILAGTHAPALGMTATPRRRIRNIVPLFENPVFRRTVGEMIKSKWLVAPIGHCVVLPGALGDIGTAVNPDSGERDYRPGSLALWARSKDAIRALVEGTLPGIGDRKTLVFAASVDHAKELAAAYEAAGLKSACVYGAMPAADRKAILAAWRAGEIQIVTNYGVLTEGFDLPEISAIVVARPTQVDLLYQQMIGRGLRKADDKTDCLVFDATSRFRDLRQVLLQDIIPPAQPPAETKPRPKPQKEKEEPEHRSEASLIFQTGNWPWAELGGEFVHVQTAGFDQRIARIWLAANPAAPQFWGIGVELREENSSRTRIAKITGQLADGLPLVAAQQHAVERLASKVSIGSFPGYWRNREPSEKQVRILRWLLGEAADDVLAVRPAAGEVSDLIDLLFARRKSAEVRRVLWPQYRGSARPLPPLDLGAILGEAA